MFKVLFYLILLFETVNMVEAFLQGAYAIIEG